MRLRKSKAYSLGSWKLWKKALLAILSVLQIFLTQIHHLTARKHCMQFALGNPQVFQSVSVSTHTSIFNFLSVFLFDMWFLFLQLSDVPISEYVDRLRNQREWGNKLDMEIMSRIYEYVYLQMKNLICVHALKKFECSCSVDFLMYKEIKKPVEKVTSNGFMPRIVLSLSYEHHFDSVYNKQYMTNAAICQCR